MKNCICVCTLVECGTKLHKDHDEKKVDKTYFKKIVGSLMCLTTIRLDIMYYVSLINKYIKILLSLHLLTTRKILRYLQASLRREVKNII